ncbi:MAG TPA: GAF domain-containing protein, partial [bacterium]|nr:GAF domain-containing protein [bacterium]
MTTLFLPQDLVISEVNDNEVILYRTADEVVGRIAGLPSRAIVVTYEEQAPEVKSALRDRDWLVLVAFGKGFEHRPPNIFSVDGEKLSAYTLYLLVQLIEVIDSLRDEVIGNYHIGVDLSSEKDPQRLWDKILSFTRRATRAEAGTLYLMSRDRKSIFFIRSQNEKLNRVDIERREIPFNRRSLVGFVCATGETLNIPDAYALPDDAPYSFNKQIDIMLGYRTHSVLTAPMKTPRGDVIGAVQLLNKHEIQSGYLPFSKYDELLLQSLASLSAVTVENNRLYEEIRGLFDSLVVSSVKAIEQRDPATKGHSVRVSCMMRKTLELLAAGDKDDFSDDLLRGAEIASMLHDFGKVGIRENILTKANKLHADDRERVFWRTRYLRERLAHETTKGHDHRKDIELIDRFLARLDAINTPAPLSDSDREILAETAARRLHLDGEELPVITVQEHRYLSIERGNLTPEERTEMEQHAVKSWEILKAMQWPWELSQVPDHVL